MAKKVNPLTKHRNGDCGCSIKDNPNRCVYQTFLDGWEFTPDVGNSKSRAEVFTPRWVVDKMVVDSGLMTESMVYQQDFSNINEETYNTILNNRVIDLATGTGNFVTEILSLKLLMVKHYIHEKFGKYNVPQFCEDILKAVRSVYAFDIDYGNVKTVWERIVGMNDSELWNDKFLEETATTFDSTVTLDMLKSSYAVKESFDSAAEHWGKHLELKNDLVGRFYFNTTGENIPEELADNVKNSLFHNLKVFNGITKDDDLVGMVPSYMNIVWRFWNEDGAWENIPMALQVVEGSIQQLENKMKKFMEDHKTTSVDTGSLFGDVVTTWDSKANENEYKKMVKELEVLSSEKKTLNEGLAHETLEKSE